MFILPLAHVKKAIKKPSVIQNLSSSVRTLGMVRITGFIFTALIIGIITHFFEKSSTWLNLVATVVAMILGDVVCFVIGTIQFMFVMKTSLTVALGYCVIPFIIPDLVKILVATIIVNRMKKYVKILN